jgi:hypothetical protein
MALKAGTPEFEKWRKQNYNLNIRVPESAIQKLRDGKTKSNNIKRFAGTDSKVMREAMNRFYGKNWEKGASSGSGKGGASDKPKGGTKRNAPNPGGQGPNNRAFPKAEQRYDAKDRNPGAYGSGKSTSKAKPKMSKYEREYKKMTGKSVKKAQKWYGTNVPTTSIGLGTVKAPKKKNADIALGMASVLVPAGGIIKAGQVVKGTLTTARVIKASNAAAASGKFFIGKGAKVIMNNTTKAQQTSVIRSVQASQRAIWKRQAAGQITRAEAKKQSLAVYKTKVGALWTKAAKKAGRIR